MLILLGVVVFLAAYGYDYAFARYLDADSPGDAADWALFCYAAGLVGLVGVLNISYWFILPEAAGLWLGTLAGWDRRPQ